jgi:hypothetical protein
MEANNWAFFTERLLACAMLTACSSVSTDSGGAESWARAETLLPQQKAKQEWANHGDSPFRVQGGVQVDSADYNPYWLLYLGAIVRFALVFDLITLISALKQQVTVRSS